MKVLVLTNAYPPDVIGGYELGCRQAVDALHRRGVEVSVLTSTPRHFIGAEPNVIRMLRRVEITAEPYQTIAGAERTISEGEASFISLHNVYALASAVQTIRPDVAYVWNINGIGGLGMLGFLQYVGVPWVWHLMDRVPSQLCEVDGKVFPDLADQAGGWLTGTYIACSSGLVDEINSDGFRLNGRIEVLPNWVEGPRPPARTRFFRRGERLRIAFAGQVVAAKGADIVIEAAAMLKAAGHIEFSIDLFGTVYELKYQHAIDAAGLSDAVRLLGLLPQTELIKRYDGYDVFIFPTYRREPFGFAPLEAVSRECVALISEDCGIAEWLVDRVHLLKTPRFASDFAQVLNDVIEGRLDLEPIGRAGANVVWRDFEVDTVMGSVASLLDEAASRPAGALGSIADAFSLAARAEHLAQTALLRR